MSTGGSSTPLRRSKSTGAKLLNGSGYTPTKSGSLAIGGSEHTTRERLSAWHRHDVPVTDVYDVVDILGEGHMGEVYKVQRKVEERGVHNSATRAKQGASFEAAPPSPLRERKGSILKTKKPKFLKKIKHKHRSSKVKDGDNAKDNEMRQILVPNIPKEPPSSSSAASPKSILKKPKVGGLKLVETTPALPALPLSPPSSPTQKNTLHNQISLEESFSGSEFCDSSSVSSSSGSVSTAASHELVQDLSNLAPPTLLRDLSAPPAPPTLANRNQQTPQQQRRIRFQRLYACKTVSTPRVKVDQLDSLMNEIYIMRTLDHPYILPLYEVYQVKRKIWLITELCTGGDLTSRKLTEPEATVILEQILYAISYMHNRNVVHRDIKLENIMYENTRKDASIRLIDFGLSQTFDRATVKRDFVRSAYTLSPEMAANKKAEYNFKTDMWCIGIVAWMLLAGDPPFLKDAADLKDKDAMAKLINSKYSFGITWSGRGITQYGKDFCKGLLKKDPNDRWTAKQALDYLRQTWIPALEQKSDLETQVKDARNKEYQEFKKIREQERKDLEERARKYKSEVEGIDTDDEEEETKIKEHTPRTNYDGPLSQKPTNILHRSISQQRKSSTEIDVKVEDLHKYCNYGNMKKTALLTMAHTMDRGDVGKLRDIFMMADIEDTGTISLYELKTAFKSFNLDNDADDETIEKIFRGIDHDKSGQIHYAEFLAALVEGQGLITMERLADAFDRIDTGGKGYISHNDLKELLGMDYDRSMVNKMIEEADFKKNGQVDYEEFLQLMFEDPEVGMSILGDDGATNLRRMSSTGAGGAAAAFSS